MLKTKNSSICLKIKNNHHTKSHSKILINTNNGKLLKIKEIAHY